MTRLFLLPGQNYTGPGNPYNKRYRARYAPRDALDRTSMVHDHSYKRYQKFGMNPYFTFNKADKDYIKSIRRQKLTGIRAGIASAVFKFKRRHFKHNFSTPVKGRFRQRHRKHRK